MKVSDVIDGRISTLELVRADGEPFTTGLVADSEVFLAAGDNGVLHLGLGEQAWEVVGASPRDRDVQRQLGSHGLPRLAWLVQAMPKSGPAERLLVQAHEFPAAFQWNEPVELGVSEQLLDDLRNRRQELVSIEKVVEWLQDKLLLHPRPMGEFPRALLAGQPAANKDQKIAFRLYGAGMVADVEGRDNDRLHVVRVVESRRAVEGSETMPVYLATGPLRFCDATQAGIFRGIARTELDQLVAQAGSYLELWREYNERESQSIVRRAQELRWLRYSRCAPRAEGEWRFVIDTKNGDHDELWQRLGALEDTQLAAGEEVPPSIRGVKFDRDAERRAPPLFVGEVVGKSTAPLSLDLRPPMEQAERIPPKRGYLFVALGGDEVRIERRQKAWERIRSCSSPMPQLGALIEGGPIPVRQQRRLQPVTRAVRKVLAEPNDGQRRALEVALNTPDIALIQGPPGTGKTRVIAALQARLAENDGNALPEGLPGSVLLTSFQHDAVENAAAATRVMGLPAVKVGHRRGDEEFHDGVDVWRRETALAVKAARASTGAERSIHTAIREVRALAIGYMEAPGHEEEPSEVLRRVLDCAGSWLPGPLAEELTMLRMRLSRRSVLMDDGERAFAMKAVRALRVEPVPFADDGPESAYKALRRLERTEGLTLTAEDRAVLEQAMEWDVDVPATPEFLAALRSARERLIEHLQGNSVSSTSPQAHADVRELLVRVLDTLGERARTSATGVDAAVDEWLEALENDVDGVRDAVKHYSMVLAATCQQAVGKQMQSIKLGDDTGDIVFKSVIVDEAARANPLDLFIPMARAERRIILVGDQRQLPHILEPDIERELSQSVQEATREALKRSLFEKLFRELAERQQRDGVPRVVTLNVQYRMHPVLGDFVSEQFYKPYGEGFGSGRPPEDFAHTVVLAGGCSLAGKVAAWIEVSRERGAELRGKSKRRPVEAARVAREAQAIVERHPELSVGVITFYADQRDAILAAMEKVELTELDDSGGYRVRERWRRTSDDRERLRIGTVDAFQGKEFDVVLLSLTRSNDVEVTDEESRRRRYGFLLLENRLCVAMSRQHRLLVVIGDMDMARGPLAEVSVPALVAFRKLCEGEHGCVIRD